MTGEKNIIGWWVGMKHDFAPIIQNGLRH